MSSAQKLMLRAALEAQGWSIEPIESLDWWAQEMWRLTSTWRPQGATAYVTFLARPDDMRPDPAAWAVGASPAAPADQADVKHVASLSPRWEASMRTLVAAIAEMR